MNRVRLRNRGAASLVAPDVEATLRLHAVLQVQPAPAGDMPVMAR